MKPPKLAQLQQRFWSLLSSHGSLGDRVKTHAEEDPACNPLQNWIHADTEEFAYQRFAIYANMYYVRLLEILQEDYTRVATAVGEKVFNDIVATYLQHHPSTTPTLQGLGRHMASFLEAHPHPQSPPWLADLARLERARTELFLHPNHDYVTSEALQEIPPEQWVNLRFSLSPVHQFVRCKYRVHLLWDDLNPDEALQTEPREVPTLEPMEITYLTHRKVFTVFHTVIHDAEEQALSMLREGEPFGVICEAFIPDDYESLSPEELQTCVQNAYGALSRWVSGGLLVSILDDT